MIKSGKAVLLNTDNLNIPEDASYYEYIIQSIKMRTQGDLPVRKGISLFYNKRQG